MMFRAFRHCTKKAYGLRSLQFQKQIKVKSFETFLNTSIPCLAVSTRDASHFTPAPPTPPTVLEVETISEVSQVLNALGEPTLSSLGLASWYPSGLVQYGLESIHVGLDVPWWAAIVIGTTIVKLATLPLTIYGQRSSANMHNHLPEITRLQNKVDRAKRANNSLEVAQAASSLYNYMKENNVKPTRNLILPLVQMPIFVSIFFGIRQMSNLPVESMAKGGVLWFTDLTTADPLFILPILTMASLFTTIELGLDGMNARTAKSKMFMRAMPLIFFPFTLNFPASILLYWFTSNGISLIQAIAMKIPGVRKMLKIPLPAKLPQLESTEKVPFFQGLKDTWKKSKTSVNVEDRIRAEAVKFREAGMGAIPKTYSYDPTKK